MVVTTINPNPSEPPMIAPRILALNLLRAAADAESRGDVATATRLRADAVSMLGA